MIEVQHLEKVFDSGTEQVAAVSGVSFDVADGQFFVLLGASGSGKTTTLRMLAGLEEPTGGAMRIGGELVYSSERGVRLAPTRRPIAMMFQTYALWPHMTVEQNVTFPLRHGRLRLRRAAARARGEEALELLHIAELCRRPVAALSGGQQQRVALARAIAQQPKVLLMDEPLSNLDAKLRAELRVSLKDLTSRLGITTVYVTHDQTEAMVMGDAIGVMHGGRLLQVGTPEEVYRRPRHVVVARFMGEMNLLTGRVASAASTGVATVETEVGALPARFDEPVAVGQEVEIGVRQEDVGLLPVDGTHPSEVPSVAGHIEQRTFLGDCYRYSVRIGPSAVLRVQEASGPTWDPDDDVRAVFPTGLLGFAAAGPALDRAMDPGATTDLGRNTPEVVGTTSV